MWMMEMIYTRNGMAWGSNNGRFRGSVYGMEELGTTDRWAKEREPGAVWDRTKERNSKGWARGSETTVPVTGMYVGSCKCP
jgi:hypothetical protein